MWAEKYPDIQVERWGRGTPNSSQLNAELWFLFGPLSSTEYAQMQLSNPLTETENEPL